MGVRLRDLATGVEWKDCHDSECQLADLYSEEGALSVPSNYDGEALRYLNLRVQRFRRGRGRCNVHIIMLPGGPGAKARSCDKTIVYLAQNMKGVAFYTMDHRGVGEGGTFTDEAAAAAWLDKIPDIVQNAPFDVKDLRLDTAALDVGLLIESIRMGGSGKVVVHGFSYGALLAQQTFALLPNALHAAFLDGVPYADGFAPPTHDALVELCQRDEFCGRRLGGDAKHTFKQALVNITNDVDYNACTRIFCDEWLGGGEVEKQGERMMLLIQALYPLLREPRDAFKASSSPVRGSHLALAFVMATNDCEQPDQYRKKVLDPLRPLLQSLRPEGLANGIESVNSFANTVIMLDTVFRFDDKAPKMPKVYANLHPQLGFMPTYYRRWQALRPYLGRRSKIAPAVTRTRVMISASESDLIAPPQPGRELFDGLKAPVKGFLLHASRSHDSYMGECQLRWLNCGIYGKECEQAKECVAKDEANTDWRFVTRPEFMEIWDLVEDRGGSLNRESPKRMIIQGDIAIRGSPKETMTHQDKGHRHKVGWRPWDPEPDDSTQVGYRPWDPLHSNSGGGNGEKVGSVAQAKLKEEAKKTLAAGENKHQGFSAQKARGERMKEAGKPTKALNAPEETQNAPTLVGKKKSERSQKPKESFNDAPQREIAPLQPPIQESTEAAVKEVSSVRPGPTEGSAAQPLRELGAGRTAKVSPSGSRKASPERPKPLTNGDDVRPKASQAPAKRQVGQTPSKRQVDETPAKPQMDRTPAKPRADRAPDKPKSDRRPPIGALKTRASPTSLWGKRLEIRHEAKVPEPIAIRSPSYRLYSRDVGEMTLMHSEEMLPGIGHPCGAFYGTVFIVLLLLKLFA